MLGRASAAVTLDVDSDLFDDDLDARGRPQSSSAAIDCGQDVASNTSGTE
jgi:hypothetical protein